MAGIIPPQKYAFFCDESGISTDRYCMVGGLSVATGNLDGIHSAMAAFRKKYNMYSELKWTKVSNQKSEEYTALVKYFFFLISKNWLHFHCIIFDSHKWNHKKYNGGDSDVGLNKLYFQIIHHRFSKTCCHHGDLFVCLDRRNSSTPLADLQRMTNAAARRDHGTTADPIAQLVSADSKKEILLQLNDVILGAVCAARNGKHLLPTTRKAKADLAALVLRNSGLSSYDVDTPKHQTKFTVWNLKSR